LMSASRGKQGPLLRTMRYSVGRDIGFTSDAVSF
jgi:hypothetical protein